MSVCSITYYETPVQNSLIRPRYHQSPGGEGTCSAGHTRSVSIKHLTLGSPFPSCEWDQAILGRTNGAHTGSLQEGVHFGSGYSSSLLSSVLFVWFVRDYNVQHEGNALTKIINQLKLPPGPSRQDPSSPALSLRSEYILQRIHQQTLPDCVSQFPTLQRGGPNQGPS